MSSILTPEFIENMRSKFSDLGFERSARMVGGTDSLAKHFFDGSARMMLDYFDIPLYKVYERNEVGPGGNYNLPNAKISAMLVHNLMIPEMDLGEKIDRLNSYFVGRYLIQEKKDYGKKVPMYVFLRPVRTLPSHHMLWALDKPMRLYDSQYNTVDGEKSTGDFMMKQIINNVIQEYNL
jgi:hypothetical protein